MDTELVLGRRDSWMKSGTSHHCVKLRAAILHLWSQQSGVFVDDRSICKSIRLLWTVSVEHTQDGDVGAALTEVHRVG